MTTIGLPPREITLAGVRPMVWGIALVVSAIAMAAMLLVYSLIFLSLGLIFASVVIGFLVAIPAARVVMTWRDCVVMSVMIGLATGLPVLLAEVESFVPAMQVILFCIAFIAVTISACRTLSRLLDSTIVTTIVLIVGLLWLTLPIWASPWLTSPRLTFVADWLLPYQPIIALNGAYPSLGEWAHHAFAYKWLTNLGQDVPYSLPAGAWRGIALHSAIAVALLLTFPRNTKTQA